MKEVTNYNNVKLYSSSDLPLSPAHVIYILYSHYNQDERYIEKQKEALARLMCKHSEVKL